MPTETLMDLALEEARAAAALGEVPIGCVIVRNGEPIARAGNRTLELKDPTAHAELLAIRAAAAMLSDEELRKLAQRADGVKADIQGGALSNTELTYVVIALVTALVVVIIFVA